MKLTFTGVGGAFSYEDQWQTNSVLEASNGKRMMIDVGHYSMLALKEAFGITYFDFSQEIDAIYITHLHGDHCGALDLAALANYFIGGAAQYPDKRKDLILAKPVAEILWDRVQRGKLETIEGKIIKLEDYFNVIVVPENHAVAWQNIKFEPIQLVHILSGNYIPPCFGFIASELEYGNPETRVYLPDDLTEANPDNFFYCTDTQFNPPQLDAYYRKVKTIFHDCETSDFPSRVHAHYDFLRTLPLEMKEKMWLVHYQPNAFEKYDPIADGFKHFVKKGQTFKFASCADGSDDDAPEGGTGL